MSKSEDDSGDVSRRVGGDGSISWKDGDLTWDEGHAFTYCLNSSKDKMEMCLPSLTNNEKASCLTNPNSFGELTKVKWLSIIFDVLYFIEKSALLCVTRANGILK